MIIHISDPHFGILNPLAGAALLEKIRELQPKLILLTGDITQRARKSEFLQAKNFFQQIQSCPVLATAGNHDIPLENIWARLFHPYANYKKYFHPQLEHFYENDLIQVFMLNSTVPLYHKDGRLKLEALQAKLKAGLKSEKIKILAFHHPTDYRKPSDQSNVVEDVQLLLNCCADFKIDLILGGHIHDSIVKLSTQRYPEISRSMILSVVGTCLSARTRSSVPNSFHSLLIKDGQIQIERFDLDDRNQKFNSHSQFKFKRTDQGWTADLG